jgi:hypothetical protein
MRVENQKVIQGAPKNVARERARESEREREKEVSERENVQ